MSIAFVGSSRSLFLRAVNALALTSGLAMAASVASAQTFTALGFQPGGTESYARGVSNTGVAAGYGYIPPGNAPETGFRAFEWTGAMTTLGTLPGTGVGAASRAVSADGSVVVGHSSSNPNDRAVSWINGGGPNDLGVLPGWTYGSNGYGVSDNGSVIVGSSGPFGDNTRAFRLTGGVMTNLGVLPGNGWVASVACGVSGNGSVVVGYCNKAQANSSVAFRWTNGTMTSLGTLKRGAFSEAWATSTNGSVIVGTSDSSTGSRAFRWTGGTMTNLGTLSGQPFSFGRAVSGDGSKVVGYSSDGTLETLGSGSMVTTGRAFYWTQATGMVDLNTYLPALGLDLTGWTLREARGISADGSTIVGWGWHNGAPEAWAARLVP